METQHEKTKLSCFDVANYFLALADEDAGDLVSNLKLQKLVYYAQGYHLAIFGRPLYPEKIEAWAHGPVIPKLYHTFKGHENKPIPPPVDLNLSKFDKEAIEFLDEVYNILGQYSAWKLRNMTHDDPPWQDAVDCHGEISHNAMKEYFKTQLVNDAEN